MNTPVGRIGLGVTLAGVALFMLGAAVGGALVGAPGSGWITIMAPVMALAVLGVAALWLLLLGGLFAALFVLVRWMAQWETTPPEVEPGTLVTLDTPGVLAPSAESKPQLVYPPMAMRQKIEGTVELRALVDEDGAVTDVRLMKGLATREDLNNAAVAYVKRWTFRPATSHGVPVKVWMPVRVEFRLPR